MRTIPIHEARLVARPVPGFPGYHATVDGRVWSAPRIVESNGGPQPVKGGIRVGSDQGKALQVVVGSRSDGTRTSKNIGALVLLAFGFTQPVGTEVAHWDGDYRNNFLGNVRWATHRENLADRERHGTMPRGERNGMVRNPGLMAGERNPAAKLTRAEVEAIRNAPYGYGRRKALSEKYGVSYQTIHKIKTGEGWKNGV